MDETFDVEVVYATPREQVLRTVHAKPGMTLIEAIERSRITEHFPEINLQEAKVGIFGKAAAKDAVLKAGDRVEIYRPLIADPKEARKKRAAEGKQLKKGGGARAGADK